MALVFCDEGKAICAGRLIGATPTQGEPKWGSWGTGAGVSSAADTTLFSESPENRVAGTATLVTSSKTNDTYQLTVTLTASATRAITNAGVFDTSTKSDPSDKLFAKVDFSTINLGTNDTITFIWKAQFVAGS